ncbi:hypothetical protein [Burkholderia ubonensis]|uniref:hypothetical protein n=1 Tax=Burkholderia ubonensis TaxID=101571 RepID=UPI0012FE2780|nr:hypothetical protein [Burkholderia ubonensis]
MAVPRGVACGTASEIVLTMMADRRTRRVRETAAALPECVIVDAKRQVPEFKRPA